MRRLLCIVVMLSIVGAAGALGAATVTIPNGEAPGWIRFDDSGNAIDAHDGEIKEFGRRYYLYGTSYGCGYLRQTYAHGLPPAPFCGFRAYESADLRHWKDDGLLFDPRSHPPASPTDWQRTCNGATLSCYRPHVLYDAKHRRYVLWVNSFDQRDGVAHGYHVLTSTTPTGPFVEARDAHGAARLPTLAYPTGGDFDLYQDTDPAHTGYIVYTVRADPLGSSYGYKLVVERLSSDFTTGTGISTGLDTSDTEAPTMFRRGSDYYVVMSDPACGYCSGTKATYLRARSPLGPWQGVGGSVAPAMHALYVDGESSLFEGRSAARSKQMAALRDYDVAFRAIPLPDTLPTTTHYRSVGWMFRADSTETGYLWVLSDQPFLGKPARLTKYVLAAGVPIATSVSAVATPLTRAVTVRTRAVGSTITTWVNGTRIDISTDLTYASGYAGIFQTPATSAYIDDFSVSRHTAHGYQVYASDQFSSGSLMSWPAFASYRRHGLPFTVNSCGGQTADVAQLRAPTSTGWEYLYQSDRWDNGDPNEAAAQQYWEPLRFAADGSLLPLLCTETSTVTLTNADARTAAEPVQTGFVEESDITAGRARGQLFTVTRNSRLSSVSLVLFQGDAGVYAAPNASAVVSLYDVDADPTLTGRPLATATVSRRAIAWSPKTVTVPLPASLTAGPAGIGHRYAIVISTTATTGVYGTAETDWRPPTVAPRTGLLIVRPTGGANGAVTPATELKYSLHFR